MMLKVDTTPSGDVERARRLFDAVERFRQLRSRLIRATPSLSAAERRSADEPFDSRHPRFTTKTEKLEYELALLYAKSHFDSDPAKLYSGRQYDVACAIAELFEIMDGFKKL
jgi:hypothetical protein